MVPLIQVSFQLATFYPFHSFQPPPFHHQRNTPTKLSPLQPQNHYYQARSIRKTPPPYFPPPPLQLWQQHHHCKTLTIKNPLPPQNHHHQAMCTRQITKTPPPSFVGVPLILVSYLICWKIGLHHHDQHTNTIRATHLPSQIHYHQKSTITKNHIYKIDDNKTTTTTT